VFRRASLSNAGDRATLLAHPEHLILGPDGLAERRTLVADENGSVVGFATWTDADGVFELEDLFVENCHCAARFLLLARTVATARFAIRLAGGRYTRRWRRHKDERALGAPDRTRLNTINNWVAGINDTLVLVLLNELLANAAPIIAVPCIKRALACSPRHLSQKISRLNHPIICG
jgi:hypothetical protein